MHLVKPDPAGDDATGPEDATAGAAGDASDADTGADPEAARRRSRAAHPAGRRVLTPAP